MGAGTDERNCKQEMDKLRKEILQNFHHELRTPLSNILMPLELAVNQQFQVSRTINFIRIVSNADRLESLVTDLTLLSDIDHGTLNTIRQPIDINVHIVAPVEKRLNRYESKQMELLTDISERGRITAPRHQFTHALVHLMDNAFKFNREKGRVGLIVRPGSNGGVVILVQDEGPGIPLEMREKVFERFYQASQGDTRAYEGLGVGLPIVRSVFQSLKGNVEILDSPQGCRVRAFLPDYGPEDIVYE
jgi:signal transduction histidine kinase